MSSKNKSQSRAETSRLNGAKSKGPTTPEGLNRSRTASFKHGHYARRGAMMPGEILGEYEDFEAEIYAEWQPQTLDQEFYVNELVANLWDIMRNKAAQSDNLHDALISVMRTAPACTDQAKLNLLAVQRGIGRNSAQDFYYSRISRLFRERMRIQDKLLKLQKQQEKHGPSQKLLNLKGREIPEMPSFDDDSPIIFPGSNSPSTAAGPANSPVEPPPAPEPAECHSPEPDPQPEPQPEPAPELTPEPPADDIDDPGDGSDLFDASEIVPGIELEAAPEPENIVDWAAANLGFQPDAVQEQILTETNKRIIILAPRQTGKSTATAVRVLYEAVHNDNSSILLASASGRQSGQILDKARQMARNLGLDLARPPSQCEGFTLANGASVIALPDSEETIRGFSAPRLIVVDEAAFASPELFKALEPMLTVSNGTFMLLSTPNGQSGFFYDKWHERETHWARIFGRLEDCPRVSPEAIEAIRKSMSEADFQQEFECRFIAAGGQFISLETYRKCLRDDFELFLPEFDNDDNFDDL